VLERIEALQKELEKAERDIIEKNCTVPKKGGKPHAGGKSEPPS